MLRKPFVAAIVVALMASTLLAQEEAVEVYKKVHPSVVSLRSLEGSGTGFVLEEDGLVLTNAHVVTSPLPYHMRVDVVKDGKTFAMIFKKVSIVGIHPKLDLALVKVDAKAAGVKLIPVTMSRTNAIPGQGVYAIGNPGAGDGQILHKTITRGIVSQIRPVEGVVYIQHDAAINSGNSGGPLCNSKGEVIGVNTLKDMSVEGVGYALPVARFTKEVFVPLDKREKDDERIAELLEYAEKVQKEIHDAKVSGGADEFWLEFKRYELFQVYAFALSHDPGNRSLYGKIGSILQKLGEPLVASAYLARGIDLDPWADHEMYVAFGQALSELGNKEQASLAFEEAIAKFPDDSEQTAVALATHYLEKEKNYAEAGYYAKLAIAIGLVPRQAEEMESLYKKAVSKLTDADRAKVDQRVTTLPDTKQLRKAAEEAKSNETKFLNEKFATFVSSYDAMANQQEEEMVKNLWGEEDDAVIAGEDTSKAVAQAGDDDDGNSTSRPTPPSDVEPAEAIDKGIQEARNLVRARQKDKAVALLKDLVETYPDHADIGTAKRLLSIWDRTPSADTNRPDPAARAIQGKIGLAKLYKRNNNTALAIKTLKEVVDQYPDHPETKAAKDLLRQWEK